MILITSSFDLLLVSIVSDSVDAQLECNWAQNFTDFNALLAEDAMQEEVMLMASEWEGKFAANNTGVDWLSGLTYSSVDIDPDTGFHIPQVREFISAEPFFRVSID